VARKAGEANAVAVVLATLHTLPDAPEACEEACRALWNLVRAATPCPPRAAADAPCVERR
jgi:hypothetical protein